MDVARPITATGGIHPATSAGAAEVTASWTSCGEALSCGGSAGSYRVTVTVIPA